MSVKIEEFVAHLGWEVDAAQLEEFNAQVKDTVKFFAKAAAAITGASVALAAFTVATNKQTAEMANLADSVGLSVDALMALDSVAQAIGKDSETIIDLVEEMNNKFGEMAALGKMTAVEESMKILGLRYKELKDLQPEEQFIKILDAAKDLEDHQKAVAGVDMLFGGEANKILGFIRTIDGSLDDFIAKRKELNFLSNEGIQQAIKFNVAWADTTSVIKTAGAEFAALLGKELRPLLEEFVTWVRANRELIKIKLALWAERVGWFLNVVFRTLKWGLVVLQRITAAFGGLENVLALIAGIITGLGLVKLIQLFIKLAPLIMKAVAAVKSFGVAGALLGTKWLGTLGLLALAGLAINSLIRMFEGRDSLVGDIGEKTGEQLQTAAHAMAEWFGWTGVEYDAFVVRWVEQTQKLWDSISGFFKEMFNLDWAGLFEAWGATWSMAVNKLRRLWHEFIAWFSTAVPNAILKTARKIARQVFEIVRQIPVVGKLITGPIEEIRAGMPGSPVTRQRPSPGVTQTINQTRAMQSAITNVSKQGGDIYVTAPMSITQQPGESGEALARRIRQGFREEMSLAIRDNDTGIEY